MVFSGLIFLDSELHPSPQECRDSLAQTGVVWCPNFEPHRDKS